MHYTKISSQKYRWFGCKSTHWYKCFLFNWECGLNQSSKLCTFMVIGHKSLWLRYRDTSAIFSGKMRVNSTFLSNNPCLSRHSRVHLASNPPAMEKGRFPTILILEISAFVRLRNTMNQSCRICHCIILVFPQRISKHTVKFSSTSILKLLLWGFPILLEWVWTEYPFRHQSPAVL